MNRRGLGLAVTKQEGGISDYETGESWPSFDAAPKHIQERVLAQRERDKIRWAFEDAAPDDRDVFIVHDRETGEVLAEWGVDEAGCATLLDAFNLPKYRIAKYEVIYHLVDGDYDE